MNSDELTVSTASKQSHLFQLVDGLPNGVIAGQTLAIVDSSQVSHSPYLQQNLALHVGDDTLQVQHHRMALLKSLSKYGIDRLQWLNQIHSTIAFSVKQNDWQLRDGDGLITKEKGIALMMMTADCLPIVLCNDTGTEVACLHAGWRGLLNGIVENTIEKIETQPTFAWLGVAISQANFEVGAEVREAFIHKDECFMSDFLLRQSQQGKYLADLYSIAKKILNLSGIKQITGGVDCSFANPNYYSYRRNSQTGRMATFVAIPK